MQSPFDGVSMRYSVADPSAPSARTTQFYSMLGSRGIWHDGWKAVTTHPTLSGWSHFNDDTWELYHTDTDRSELHDLAAEHPDKLRELVNLWFAEAGANGAFPLDDRSALEIIMHAAAAAGLAAQPLRLLPRHRRGAGGAGGQHPQPVLLDRRAGRHPRSRARRACCSRTGPGSAATPCTSRTTGCTTSTTSSASWSRRSTGPRTSRPGENLILSASFDKDGEDPPGVATGILSLYHGDKKVGEGRIKTQPGMFSLAGEGLCVGRDSGEPVTGDYPGPHPHRSPAAPSSGSPSTSAASLTSTSSARPRPCWPASSRPRVAAARPGLRRLRGQCGGQAGQEDVEAALEFGGAVVGGQDGGEAAQQREFADRQPVQAQPQQVVGLVRVLDEFLQLVEDVAVQESEQGPVDVQGVGPAEPGAG